LVLSLRDIRRSGVPGAALRVDAGANGDDRAGCENEREEL